jgi:hypothetical protein
MQWRETSGLVRTGCTHALKVWGLTFLIWCQWPLPPCVQRDLHAMDCAWKLHLSIAIYQNWGEMGINIVYCGSWSYVNLSAWERIVTCTCGCMHVANFSQTYIHIPCMPPRLHSIFFFTFQNQVRQSLDLIGDLGCVEHANSVHTVTVAAYGKLTYACTLIVTNCLEVSHVYQLNN